MAIRAELPYGLIVSCQADTGEALFGPLHMAAMARAALEGGAVGIRANSPPDIAAIRQAIPLPIIGLYKVHSAASPVYITPDGEAAAAVAAAGADIIAIDATPRQRPGALSLSELVSYIHTTLRKPILADVACLEEAQQAEGLGVEYIATTLAGYTDHGRPAMEGPDVELLSQLIAQCHTPVIAEGRYTEPAQVRRAFELGAHAVVVGSAITRPQIITRRFASAVPAPTHRAV